MIGRLAHDPELLALALELLGGVAVDVGVGAHLERVYVCGSLWDAYEMGGPADVHCYTPAEFERKVEQLAIVREAAERGLELLPEPA